MRLPGCRLHSAPTKYTFYRKASHINEVPSFDIARPNSFFDLMSARYEPQFLASPETWCHSGLGRVLGGYKAYLDDCADACKLAGPRCAGFNVRLADGICFAFEAGCLEEISSDWIFFVNRQAWKRSLAEEEEAERERDRERERNRALSIQFQDRYPNFPSFNRLIHMKCTGGLSSPVFEQNMKSPQDCAIACMNNYGCYGFSFRGSDNFCIGRTPGCTLDPDSEFVFYVKNTQ